MLTMPGGATRKSWRVCRSWMGSLKPSPSGTACHPVLRHPDHQCNLRSNARVLDSGRHRRAVTRDVGARREERAGPSEIPSVLRSGFGARSCNPYSGAGVTLSLGTPIGHYTVVEHVGAEGTTAEVYRAQDERHDRIVALKLLSGTSERSRRAAIAVTALDHPNIVATFDVTQHNGRAALRTSAQHPAPRHQALERTAHRRGHRAGACRRRPHHRRCRPRCGATDPPPVGQPGTRGGTKSDHDPVRCRST